MNFEQVVREWGARKIEAAHPHIGPVDRARVRVELSNGFNDDGFGEYTPPSSYGSVAVEYQHAYTSYEAEYRGTVPDLLAELIAVADEQTQ